LFNHGNLNTFVPEVKVFDFHKIPQQKQRIGENTGDIDGSRLISRSLELFFLKSSRLTKGKLSLIKFHICSKF